MVLTMAASNHVDIPEPDPERYAPSGNGLSTDEALLLDALMGAHNTYFIPGTDEHDAHEAEIAAPTGDIVEDATEQILDGLSAEGLSAPNSLTLEQWVIVASIVASANDPTPHSYCIVAACK